MKKLHLIIPAALVAAFSIQGRETVLEDSPSRLTLEITVSGYQLEGSLGGSRIVSEDFSGRAKTGGPDLPWYRFQVASGDQIPSVSIEALEWIDIPLPSGLAGVPRWLTPQKSEEYQDAALFGQAGNLTPEISSIQRFRGMALRSIALPTGTYVEGSGQARLLKRFRVHVAFSDARSTPDARVREWLLQAGIKNVHGGQYLTTLPRPDVLPKTAARFVALGATFLKVKIGDRQVDGLAEDGVHALKYETALAAASGSTGILGAKVSNLRVFSGPKNVLNIVNDSLVIPPTLREIPIDVEDNNHNGTFDGGDRVLFYGHGTSVWNPIVGVAGPVQWIFSSDPYSFENFYYLDWSSPGGSRLAERAAHPAADTFKTAPHYLRAEQDLGTGSCDLSNRFDAETGYDWYWWFRGSCGQDPPPHKPETPTLSALQLRSSTTDTIKGYVTDTAWLGIFNHQGQNANIFRAWAGGDSLNPSPISTLLAGSWFTLPTLTNEKLELESVQWYSAGDASDRRFEGYTVRYTRNLKWEGQERMVFPAATGKWVAYKVENGAGVRCLRVESGVGAHSLPMIALGADGVFTDSAVEGEDVQYFLYAAARNLGPTDVSTEKIRTDAGMIQDYGTGNGQNPQYLIIAPDALLSEALKLQKYRQDSKRLLPLTTSVMRTEDIYREWSGGRMSPIAIRNAIRYALNQWGTQLRYVVLYGDGHYDYRNLRNSSTPPANPVPPFNWDNPDNEANPMSTDDFFGVLGGGSNWSTGLMDVAVGRLPIQTLEQARNYLEKVSKYEDPVTAGVWRSRATLTADDATQHKTGDDPDPITGHTSQSERLGNTIAGNEPGTRLEKLTLFDYKHNANYLKPEAATDLLSNLNQGTLFLSFFGHGAYNQWADEVLMKTNDALARLHNSNQNFMVAVFSCTVGRFEMLSDEGMMEAFVRQKDYAAIAGLGAARESFPDANEALATAFVARVFPSDSSVTLQGVGLALQSAKNAIPIDATNKQKYVLFGEPTVVIRRPGPAIQLEPSTLPDTLQALQCGTMRGRIPGGSGHGFVNARIVGSDIRKDYPAGNVVYKHGPILFERTIEYKDSTFSMDYFLPKQVSFGDSTAKIQFFAWDAEKPMETSRAVTGLRIQGTAAPTTCSATDDGKGPRIAVTGCNVKESGEVNFPDRVKISLPYCLQIDVTDSSGGVMSGNGPDEGTTVEVTGVIDPFHPQPGVDELYHKSYQLTLQNGEVSAGTHLLKVTARDGFGNLGSRQLSLEAASDTALRFVKTFNAPNPMKRNGTAFYFSTTLPQDLGSLGVQGQQANSDRVRFDLRIYNQVGYMVQEFRDAQSGMRWDGRDAWGQNLANGVYFYQVTANWSESNGAPTQGVKTSLRNILVLSR